MAAAYDRQLSPESFEVYVSELAEVVPEPWVADEAIRTLVRSHKFWPTLAEIIDACGEVRERSWEVARASGYVLSPQEALSGRAHELTVARQTPALTGEVEQRRGQGVKHVRDLLKGIAPRGPRKDTGRMRTNDAYWERVYGKRAVDEAEGRAK